MKRRDRITKNLEMGDHVIAHTPGAKQPIYANRGADHPAYSGFTHADHIAAANVHANRAKELHIASARQGNSMTLKRQAMQHMHLSSTHRQAGVAQPKRIAASAAGKCDAKMVAKSYYEQSLKAVTGLGGTTKRVDSRSARP